MGVFTLFLVMITSLLCLSPSAGASNQGIESHRSYVSRVIQTLSDADTRRCGSTGHDNSADFIRSEFKRFGFSTIGSHLFSLPVRQHTQTRITLPSSGKSIELQPFVSNQISPGTLSAKGLEGHAIYVGSGELDRFNGYLVKDAIVFMDLASNDHWINALSLGAKALVYVQKEDPDRFLFEDKIELTPVEFPRFVISYPDARTLLGELLPADEALGQSDQDQLKDWNTGPKVTLYSDLKWHQVPAQNIYCLVEGTDNAVEDELVIVEAFYDTSEFIAGRSPGADQACSIAALLDLARYLSTHPPHRSILLVATSGHANTLTGMREMIWSIKEKSRNLKKDQKSLEKDIDTYARQQEALSNYFDILNSSQGQNSLLEDEQLKPVQAALTDIIKSRIDELNTTLMQLRLAKDRDTSRIKNLAAQRMAFKRLMSRKNLDTLSPEEVRDIKNLVPAAETLSQQRLLDARRKLDELKSARKFRKLMAGNEIQAVISLHLSSHGDGFGAFSRGWLYPLKSNINRYSPYTTLDKVLQESSAAAARELGTPNLLKDTLRPSLQRSWESYFKDRPALGGEVSSLAGMLGITLVTTNDARRLWGTPYDRLKSVDIENITRQSRFISRLLTQVTQAPKIRTSKLPRNGFATIRGRANFLRHGELFAEAPAPQSMILSFQGPGIYHTMVDEAGEFMLKGVADKKHVLEKVIIEGYRFDPLTGDTIWAIDKKQTTKARYRLKMTKKNMETDLTMFACNMTTLANLLEPRTFNYMTKVELFDARTDAQPLKYWYSRIDTRRSLLCSLYLEPGTRFKLTLSDSLLTRKLILSNSDSQMPMGGGYLIDADRNLMPTVYHAARDMWTLLTPRINNLEKKGINNQKIRDIRIRGNQALTQAGTHLENRVYDRFMDASATAMALAGRVYEHVEKTQKDVLYGVLFYIVLFVPFAFCLERFLFSFTNIYKRILGFLSILLIQITVIYNVHPAFELAYSPVVIILAFFIIGLSIMVTWIIFNRFEGEIANLQRQGHKGDEGEISLFKAFFASFFMGVSNLRRRRTRTLLTCMTLIILTFTLMSFTSVKNIREHVKVLYDDKATYHGLLLKQLNWTDIPQSAFAWIKNTMGEDMLASPRAWLETRDRTRGMTVPLSAMDKTTTADAVIGLTHTEPLISGIDQFITQGRWFKPGE
ncbi:MAG: M28 family peptidase, partial [Desulfobacteraceae bacterium]